MMSGLAASRFVVRGRVQGVGFRWFVLLEAAELDLAGYVKNLPDGSVEVLARGQAGAMTRLEAALARGPASARVDRVDKEDLSHELQLPKPFGVK